MTDEYAQSLSLPLDMVEEIGGFGSNGGSQPHTGRTDPNALPIVMPPSHDSQHLEIASDGDEDDDELRSPDSTKGTIPPLNPNSPATQFRNLYVANLPPHVDAPFLRQMFGKFGSVNHVKLLLDIATGVSRGIAFIMFDEPGPAREALASMHRHQLGGRTLQVRFAEKDAEKKHERVVGHIIYVRNIPATATKGNITTFFSQFGDVAEVDYHPQSAELGGPSPYNMCFIKFFSDDFAAAAVDAVDGKAPFPLPKTGHPFVVARVVHGHQLVAEKRKSVLLRLRHPASPQQMLEASETSQVFSGEHKPPPLPSFGSSCGNVSPQHVLSSVGSMQPPENNERSLSFSLPHSQSQSSVMESTAGYTQQSSFSPAQGPIVKPMQPSIPASNGGSTNGFSGQLSNALGSPQVYRQPDGSYILVQRLAAPPPGIPVQNLTLPQVSQVYQGAQASTPQQHPLPQHPQAQLGQTYPQPQQRMSTPPGAVQGQGQYPFPSSMQQLFAPPTGAQPSPQQYVSMSIPNPPLSAPQYHSQLNFHPQGSSQGAPVGTPHQATSGLFTPPPYFASQA